MSERKVSPAGLMQKIIVTIALAMGLAVAGLGVTGAWVQGVQVASGQR